MIRFTGPHPANDILPVLELSDRVLTVSYFKVASTTDPNATEWEAFYPFCKVKAHPSIPQAGFPDYTNVGTTVKNVPNCGETQFVYKGKITLDLDSMIGHDEYVDYSVIDFAIRHDGTPLRIFNRFSLTKGCKIEKSFRGRALFEYQNSVVLVIPFAKASLNDIIIDVVHGPYEPIGVTPDIRETPNNTGMMLHEFFYTVKVVGEPTVAPDGTVEVSVELRSNKDDSLVEHPTTLLLENDAGYLPRRKLQIDETGKGIFKIKALGNDVGETLRVKFNTVHYTAIGTAEIKVS